MKGKLKVNTYFRENNPDINIQALSPMNIQSILSDLHLRLLLKTDINRKK